MDYTCAKSQATVYSIRLPGLKGWAKVSIEEWNRGGSFQAITDFGNYDYIWASIGDRCLRKFLVGLDYGYFMTKAHPSHGMEFDAEASAKVIRAEIKEHVAEDPIRSQKCNEALDEIWDDLQHVDEQEFFHVIEDSDLFHWFYQGDYYSITTCHRRQPQCDGFWKNIWPCLCEVWRNELEVES